MTDAVLPRETLAITFFEHPVLAARLGDGSITLSVRDLCDATGLNLRSQLRRLRADEDLRDGLHRLRVMTAGGPQDQEFLILEFVPAWIASVNRARASVVVRERLRYLRLFSIRQVYDALAQAAHLPEGASSQIEDLAELERFDQGITGIAARQQALEESQDRARSAWRDHEQRIRLLEEQIGMASMISPMQRGQVYQLVQTWALARIEREQVSSATAFAGCWAAIKTRYQIAKYEHLPASKFGDCVAYIRQAYHRLTGTDLMLTEAES